LTGIGFLGAGVIFHNIGTQRIFGVTTAACVWLTACIGMMCGIGEWRLLIVALLLLFLLLVIGGPIEDILHRRWGRALDKSEEK